MKWAKIRAKIKYVLLFGFCLLLLLLFPSCTPAYASQTYIMSEAELIRLEQNLQMLAENSKSKQAQLQMQSEQLKKLNEQLTLSLAQNKETKQLLANAEESLRKYAEEVKRKETIKTRQRNLWIIIAGIATAWAVCK